MIRRAILILWIFISLIQLKTYAQDTLTAGSRWLMVEGGYTPFLLMDKSSSSTNKNDLYDWGGKYLWPSEKRIFIKPFQNYNLILGGALSLVSQKYPHKDLDSSVLSRSFKSKKIMVGYVLQKKNFLLIPSVNFGHRKGTTLISMFKSQGPFDENINEFKILDSYGSGVGLECSWLFLKPLVLSASFTFTHYFVKNGLPYDSGLPDHTFFNNYIPNKNVLKGSIMLGLYLDNLPFK